MSTDLHTLSGAYALDALSPLETDAFDRHLEGCSSCRDEVRELQEAASTMGAVEATRPPAALRARVLAAADQQRQLPPRVTPIEFASSRRWTARLSSRIVGAAAAVALGVGGVATLVHNRGDQPSQPPAATSVSEVFSAADVHIKTIRTSDGRPLRVASSARYSQLAIATDSLRRLNGRRVYQLWTVHNGRSTSAGVVSDLNAGKVMAIPTYGTTVAITVEPLGGSQHPTTKPIVQLNPQTV